MPRILVIILSAGAMVLISACTSDHQDDPNHVSTIPWNRPEQWESQGPLSGMMPNSQ